MDVTMTPVIMETPLRQLYMYNYFFIRFALITLLLSIASNNILAGDNLDELMCPDSIKAMVPTLLQGWEISHARNEQVLEHPLVSVSFSDGPPTEWGFLKPNGTGPENAAIYNFSGISPKGIWLVCEYENTDAVLTQTISDEIKACTVMTSENTADHIIHCQ